MKTSTGFSDVDASGRPDDLVAYLALLADRLAGFRRAGYEMLRLAPGATVLDVGCGTGEACVEIAGRVGAQGRVVGIDPSKAMIAAARKAAGSRSTIDLRVASIYTLPFPDGAFDAVRAERVFQHLDEPEPGLREMIRVMRPGGRILVADPDHGQQGLALDDPAHQRTFAATRRAMLAMIANPHSGTRLRGMLVRAGLAEIEQTVHPIPITFAEYVRAVFLADRLAAAVEADEITREAADAFIAALEAREHEGTFDANAIAYFVAGTRP